MIYSNSLKASLAVATALVLSAPALASTKALASTNTHTFDTIPAQAATQSVAQTSSGVYLVAMAEQHAQWDRILGQYVVRPDPQTGLAKFNYGALKANRADAQALADYIKSLEATDPSTLSEDEAVVFWANLYNAVTVKLIIDNYPVSSIREIKSGLISIGPWSKDIITVNGRKMSLNDVEHGTMRKQFPSPHIHYMVNCASIGCPNLLDSAWKASSYKSEREEAARAFINSPRGVRVTDSGLRVSSIYKWYKEDFGGNEAGILQHLRDFADADLAAAIDGGAKIVGYDYDWDLNE